MKILAVDASSSRITIAVIESEGTQPTLLYRYDEAHERTNSTIFFKGLEEAILQTGKPDRIVVGLGPGSYNGLRISIAAAQGMSSALHTELVGIPTPLALPGPASGYWACGDARGGHYWVACVREHHFIKEPFLLPPASLEEHIAQHPTFPLISSTQLKEIPPQQKAEIFFPDAELLAIQGSLKQPSPATPEPLYLKPPSITLQPPNACKEI